MRAEVPAQGCNVARSVPSGAAWNTVAPGPMSRTAARSLGSGCSASLTRAAASRADAPLDTAIATARRSADRCSDGRATAAAAYVRPVSSRTAAPSGAATRARVDRASVMIFWSSGPSCTSVTRMSVGVRPGARVAPPQAAQRRRGALRQDHPAPGSPCARSRLCPVRPGPGSPWTGIALCPVRPGPGSPCAGIALCRRPLCRDHPVQGSPCAAVPSAGITLCRDRHVPPSPLPGPPCARPGPRRGGPPAPSRTTRRHLYVHPNRGKDTSVYTRVAAKAPLRTPGSRQRHLYVQRSASRRGVHVVGGSYESEGTGRVAVRPDPPASPGSCADRS